MVNRERGELQLVTRQRSYMLRLTVDACGALEGSTGRRLRDVIEGVNGGRATDVRWLLWASLQAKHGAEAQTPEMVGSIISNMGGLERAVLVLADFMALNTDDEAKDDVSDAETDADTRPGSLWRRLYLDARGLGVAPEAFWALSLRELWLELAAATQRHRQEQERDLAVAWWVASLSRQERLPSLSMIIGKQDRKRAAKPQTWQEMKAALMALTGYTGKEGQT